MENPKRLTDISQGAIYSPGELVAVLKLDKRRIIAYCETGRIKAHKAGREWFIPGSSVVLYFAELASSRTTCSMVALI